MDGFSLSGFSFGGFLEVSDEVPSFVGLLQTGEDHLGAWDVLLGVFQVFKQSFRTPCDALGFVGISVDVASSLTGLAAKETIEVRSSLVLASSLYRVALGATLNKEL